MVGEDAKALLSERSKLEYVARVSDDNKLMKMLWVHKPDMLLTGLFLKSISPLPAFHQCRTCMLNMGIIVLPMPGQQLSISESEQAVEHAFISKYAEFKQLLKTFLRVTISQRILFPEGMNPPPKLNSSERKVLHGIACGLTTEKIAATIASGSKLSIIIVHTCYNI